MPETFGTAKGPALHVVVSAVSLTDPEDGVAAPAGALGRVPATSTSNPTARRPRDRRWW
ncbi:hypothetical protein PV342_21260 [Streptomyces sp. PA03-3a]|nr:hypothetical protein [Streptomyces sp. PA03-6a]MDX2850946.1 hypothetical protein [Streptomyces sp. PA03-3a]